MAETNRMEYRQTCHCCGNGFKGFANQTHCWVCILNLINAKGGNEMKGLLVLLAVSLALIIGLIFTSPSYAIAEEDIDFGIVELYAIDLVRSDTISEVYVDPLQWNSLTYEAQAFVAYLFAVKKVRSGEMTSDIAIHDHKTGKLIVKFHFDGGDEGE